MDYDSFHLVNSKHIDNSRPRKTMAITVLGTEMFFEVEQEFVGRLLHERSELGAIYRWMWFRVTTN